MVVPLTTFFRSLRVAVAAAVVPDVPADRAVGRRGPVALDRAPDRPAAAKSSRAPGAASFPAVASAVA